MNRKLRSKIYEKFDSQADFGQAIGMQEARISRIIRGRVQPRCDEVKKMAEKLKCEIREIFPGRERRH